MSKTRFTLRAVSSLAKKPRQYTIEQFMATTALGGASFSADEKRILFHSNESGIFNALSASLRAQTRSR